ncbi:hypothetical protein [Mycobacterium intracellulare]|uniref:Uncharacterized protein n=1 Tax=Mycobacterium intracellulare TaxID=1767 RepID=A0AAE4R890_MYCIT|nr:hypothetical protein [Mycobacterium intracellulare]MDV6975332.1 hypothetical protein [Mycobacterium intracellulare]MDV6980396.1 hypothetical protein [Mycobacterium intracellulare]MDV7010825.1 hypothetical protein [Mycobacterium intracellulare]MDV7025731.1 hypothetical protein [Mycobacterium intracellulare]
MSEHFVVPYLLTDSGSTVYLVVRKIVATGAYSVAATCTDSSVADLIVTSLS